MKRWQQALSTIHHIVPDTIFPQVLFILLVEMAVLVSIVLHVIEDHWVYAWFYAMFVAGTCLPPLLVRVILCIVVDDYLSTFSNLSRQPTVFVVSVGISCKRLQAKRITCTDSTGESIRFVCHVRYHFG